MGVFGQWGNVPASTSFKRQVDTWNAQKEKLARVLDVVDYQLIQAAFSNIQYIEDALKTAQQAGDPDGGLKRLLTDASHAGRINTIQEAEAIALRASLRVVDRLKARRHMKRLAELPGASEFLAGVHPAEVSPDRFGYPTARR